MSTRRARAGQQLFPDLDDLDELGLIGVEVDHIAGFTGRLSARVDRHRHIGLG